MHGAKNFLCYFHNLQYDCSAKYEIQHGNSLCLSVRGVDGLCEQIYQHIVVQKVWSHNSFIWFAEPDVFCFIFIFCTTTVLQNMEMREEFAGFGFSENL